MGLVAGFRATGFRQFHRFLSCLNSRTLIELSKNRYVRELDLQIKNQRQQSLATPCVVSARSFADKADPRAVVDFHEFKELLSTQDYFIVDVREAKELAEDGRLIGAINIPLGQVDTEFAKSPRQLKSQYHRLALDEEGRNIVFFCKAGVRAEKALTTAQKHGYTKARFYKGSFLDWIEKGGQIIKG
ncbi:thiosulfate sulfurtransferase/rhodanese-like domain-containing protein 1 isoform X1 [Varroa jacobsoni]|uniref:thiosulfate sulfurtransferase/rhodanese-like domain-containing protein 1 isoform X1 n=1 Tax=Varroa jacobsoni TaxID=62625 RepID=UPI000BF72458|nr:thiosulfate sulfurtransferase/rhodanese-like domain-containing protein 1 isoform X1 [Varroa jacobsoni]